VQNIQLYLINELFIQYEKHEMVKKDPTARCEIVALEFLRKGNVEYVQHVMWDMGIVRKLARTSAGVN